MWVVSPPLKEDLYGYRHLINSTHGQGTPSSPTGQGAAPSAHVDRLNPKAPRPAKPFSTCWVCSLSSSTPTSQGTPAGRHREGKGSRRLQGRKPTVDVVRVRALQQQGIGPSAIAKTLGIGRASVYRALCEQTTADPSERDANVAR